MWDGTRDAFLSVIVHVITVGDYVAVPVLPGLAVSGHDRFVLDRNTDELFFTFREH